MKQDAIKDRLVEEFGDEVILDAMEFRGELSVKIAPEKIAEVCVFLRDDGDLDFNFLSAMGGIDWYPESPRFEVFYQLYSLRKGHRFRIKARIEDDENPAVDSVTDIWPSANWHERETAEMFGITFRNHPDPRKLLLPEEWTVYPLRKDFPLEGDPVETPDLPRTTNEGN